MDNNEAIGLLQDRIKRLDALKTVSVDEFATTYKKLSRDTDVILKRIFGNDSNNFDEFNKCFRILNFCIMAPIKENGKSQGITESKNAKAVLQSMIDEITEYGLPNCSVNDKTLLENIALLCDRFHLIVKQFRNRYDNRQILDIEDEYDVQDLMHSLLHLYFDDIRPEEWTPSHAGASSRVDFLLKNEQIVIEIKKTRKGLNAKKLGEELIIDSARYKSHPDCKSLICFVYDPEGRIVNPRGLENDLSKISDGLDVKVFIRP